MPPADVVGVLLVGVLAVVQQQRRVLRKAEARDPVVVERLERDAEGGLVVRDVTERGVALLDPVTERRPAVGDRGRGDPRRADLPLDVGAFWKRTSQGSSRTSTGDSGADT